MIILAIDPGPEKSAYCYYDTILKAPTKFFTQENYLMDYFDYAEIAIIEQIASYGMAVGETIFETCVWTGRLIERLHNLGIKSIRIKRKEVAMHISNSVRAKDANIIQALKDRFGEKGTKKNPGVLYGIKADEWQALALAVTYADKLSQQV